jgi:hypothetical protein
MKSNTTLSVIAVSALAGGAAFGTMMPMAQAQDRERSTPQAHTRSDR